jgi:hypothetical protein
MSKTFSIAFGVILSLSAIRYLSAQNSHSPLPSSVPQSPNLPTGSRAPSGQVALPDDGVQKQQAAAANEQRQVEIRRDTEKMAELTQELKAYLEKPDQGVMSVDAIKKAEQIEKLAHSVKSKMKQSF